MHYNYESKKGVVVLHIKCHIGKESQLELIDADASLQTNEL